MTKQAFNVLMLALSFVFFVFVTFIGPYMGAWLVNRKSVGKKAKALGCGLYLVCFLISSGTVFHLLSQTGSVNNGSVAVIGVLFLVFAMIYAHGHVNRAFNNPKWSVVLSILNFILWVFFVAVLIYYMFYSNVYK